MPRQKAEGLGGLLFGRAAAKGQLPRAGHLVGAIAAAFFLQALGESGGLVEDELAVHQHEGLCGDGRRLSALAVDFHHRLVEGVEHRQRTAAADFDIDAAPKLFSF